MTESELQTQVADYLMLRYPKVLFHSDFGSGIKLTMGQAIKQKRQNGGRRAWPDMIIARPMPDKGYCAMFIELKKEGTRLFKKDGTPASDHLKEQSELLEELERWGYKAVFAVGFDEAKRIIDEYLG
jgi:hypothetical protein